MYPGIFGYDSDNKTDIWSLDSRRATLLQVPDVSEADFEAAQERLESQRKKRAERKKRKT